MYDWAPIAVAIVAFAAVSGAIRRMVAPTRGEKRNKQSAKASLFQSLATVVLFAVFLIVVLTVIGGMAKG
jgi:hypothetical protein